MSGLSIKHPEQAPVWLADWFSDKDLRILFKPGIISAACSALARPGGGFTLSWEKDFLQARIGVFTSTWRRQDEIWRPRCNCNYPDAYCLHSYAAGLLLTEVCRQQGWSQPSASPKPLFSAKPKPQAAVQQSFMADLFSTEKPPQRKMTLEVEADFHHEQGRVGIRFYAREDGERQLLKLGNVRMYAADLLQENRWNPRSWPELDAEFLKWITAPLRKIPLRQHDLRMLNLSAEEFLDWRKRWREQPRRFLNRDTQEFIAAPGEAAPARLIVEIETVDGGWRIRPFFIFPDGRRRQPYEIMRQLANDPNRLEIRRQVLAWHPPLAWATLNHWFGTGKPLLLKAGENLAKLDEILQGRLDLLEGECLEKVLINSSKMEVRADFKLGKFQVYCIFQDEKVPLEREWPPRSRIGKSANRLKVLVTAPDEQALQLREDLRAFGKRLGQVQEFQVQLEGSLKNAVELKAFWRNLPEATAKQSVPSLKELLQDEPGKLTTELSLRGQGGLLELGVNWQLNGVSIPAAELQSALRHQQPVMHLSSGQWLSIDAEKARRLMQKLEEAGIDIGETIPLLRHQAAERIGKLTAKGEVALAATSQSFYDRLCREPQANMPTLPEELEPILRAYQKSGFEFLVDRCFHGAGCILADDMGLGKTLQVLSVLFASKTRAQKAGKSFTAIVVCPATVMEVWKTQAEKFIPSLEVAIWGGNKKVREHFFRRGSFDVLVTHYGMMRQEQELLTSRDYDFVVLDEAQAIKNPDTQVTQAIKSVSAKNKLALTGTPMENKILDLWSIMDFLNPKFFGQPEDFLRLYSNNLAALRKRSSLLLLRRSKALVASELPPRVVEVLPIELSDKQRQLYDSTLLKIRQSVKEYGAMQILAGLTKLRQICCDPELVLKTPSEETSGKLEVLLEKLNDLAETGHSALVFSQFTSMLSLIAPRLREAGIPFWTITGETPLPRRAELTREFSQAPRPGVFLLSLKAAGTGLTLTKADYVFLFDPWWNPAVENQAIDRAHRLGQDKTVMAYRMVARNSVEERVLALIEQKQELFDAVLGGETDQVIPAKLSREDLLELLA